MLITVKQYFIQFYTGQHYHFNFSVATELVYCTIWMQSSTTEHAANLKIWKDYLWWWEVLTSCFSPSSFRNMPVPGYCGSSNITNIWIFFHLLSHIFISLYDEMAEHLPLHLATCLQILHHQCFDQVPSFSCPNVQ